MSSTGLQLPVGSTTANYKVNITPNSSIVNGNKKYSLNVDSDGNNLLQEQQDYFNNSKVRDENGKLVVMYHGTPNSEFTEFREESYFTSDKSYAKQ